jgi:hypothetical protein
VADTLDVVTLAVTKAALGIADATTTHDVELARMITAVSRVMDDVVGPIVVRTVTTEQHRGGMPTIRLRRRPVTTVTTVREVTAPGSIATLSAVAWGAAGDGYEAPAFVRNPSLLSGALHRAVGGYNVCWKAAEVTYQAGRYANTAAVDARFAEAATEVLRRLWRRETGVWLEDTNVYEEHLNQPPADASGYRTGFFRAVKPIVCELLHDELDVGPWVA